MIRRVMSTTNHVNPDAMAFPVVAIPAYFQSFLCPWCVSPQNRRHGYRTFIGVERVLESRYVIPDRKSG
jgi:hypothetical protein